MKYKRLIVSSWDELTPQALDAMGHALIRAKAEAEQEIAMCLVAADALEATRHYKQIDKRLARRIEQANPGTSAKITWDVLRVTQCTTVPSCCLSLWRREPLYAYTSVRIDDDCTVSRLIDALRACEGARDRLQRTIGQFGGMEELIDAEEQIRHHTEAIETLRQRVANETLGTKHYWHEAVARALPALTSNR